MDPHSLSREEQTALLDGKLEDLIEGSGRRYLGLKRMEINTVRDLINFFPFRYNDFSQVSAITQVRIGMEATVFGVVRNIKVKRPRKRLLIIEAELVDASGMLVATWFNQPWLQNTLVTDAHILVKGKVEHNYGFYRMASPQICMLSQDEIRGGIYPVYHANSDISQGWVARIITETLDKMPALLDPLPPALRTRFKLMSRNAALRQMHSPSDEATRLLARRRLAFEEIFLLQVYMQQQRRLVAAKSTAPRHVIDGEAVRGLRDNLPFTLTDEQEKAIAEIFADMHGEQNMSRLLLGDVGSGKTIVAAFALAATHDSKKQSAMMAPTEVLSRQYAQKLGPLLDDIGVSWAQLSSSTTKSERSALLEALASGQTSVIFGTHALLEDDVRFAGLSLVVIDEQHRFGVKQRQALIDKANRGQTQLANKITKAKNHAKEVLVENKPAIVDLLSMSATPIPRSLALTIYGDMDTSYIRSKPRNDSRIVTKQLTRADIRFAYSAIDEAINNGEQCYIVCPLISSPADTQAKQGARIDNAQNVNDRSQKNIGYTWIAPNEEQQNPSDEFDSEPELFTEFSEEDDAPHIKAATEEVEYLRAVVFPNRRIELLTSKMPTAQKQQVMDDFRSGIVDILVSTTVIEVGVDVPNATVMVIQDADRFGLSQLHQLRGRIGRGQKDGKAFLVSATKNPDAIERLKIMEQTSDGFELAKYDLKMRREGDILGSRQHGISSLKLINVVRDGNIINAAHQLAKEMLDVDPMLCSSENALLAREIKMVFPSDSSQVDDDQSLDNARVDEDQRAAAAQTPKDQRGSSAQYAKDQGTGS